MTWIQTDSGNPFNYLYPDDSVITIEDIASGLCSLVRFNGHSNWIIRWTVAQHCLMMADAAEDDEIALACLMHDATEAYMSDVASPLKELLPKYREVEENVTQAILARFSLHFDPHVWDIVKLMDKQACAWEAIQLQGPQKAKWAMGREVTYPFKHVEYYHPEETREQFINKFNELTQLQTHHNLRETAGR